MLRRTLMALVLAASCAAATLTAPAQQGGTTRYVYDDNGRLHAVIAPSGETAIYEYDAAGNLTAVRRLPPDALALFNFSPREGYYGTVVTFTGTGFGGGVTGVTFNGAPAAVIEFTNSSVVAEVPQGATTGPVTITTPRGSVTTATPFTIRGVRVTPSEARVMFGQTVQFVAEVIAPGEEQGVTWTVNGVSGGNTTTGTVTAGGLYTAPAAGAGTVTVRATSVSQPELFDEAQVSVRDPNDVQGVLSAGVSVARGENAGKVAASAPVSLQFGSASGIETALSPFVSVERGENAGNDALAPPVSVRYGSEYGAGSATSGPVTATTGPVIDGISPARVTRGTSVTLTVTGRNLHGATALRFIRADGVIDTALTVANISVNAEGTALTLTLTTGGSAALGRRVVVVAAPGGDTMTVDLGTNTIEVAAP